MWISLPFLLPMQAEGAADRDRWIRGTATSARHHPPPPPLDLPRCPRDRDRGPPFWGVNQQNRTKKHPARDRGPPFLRIPRGQPGQVWGCVGAGQRRQLTDDQHEASQARVNVDRRAISFSIDSVSFATRTVGATRVWCCGVG